MGRNASKGRLSRRDFLRVAVTGAESLALAACDSAPPAVVPTAAPAPTAAPTAEPTAIPLPERIPSMPLTLSPHPNLVDKPAINLLNAVVLTPDCYTTWDEMFEAHKSKTQYLLTPGNYTCWGNCVREDIAGGTPLAPKLIAYYNPGVDDHRHPVDRVGGNEALCADFQFKGEVTTNWMVHGITTRGGAGNWLMRDGCSGITFDYCLIEDKAQSVTTYMIRIRDAADCTVQRCVIRNILPKQTLDNRNAKDSTGIAIGNIERDVIGIRILDSEIYNVGDCIQLTDGPIPWKPVEVVIEGCDLYMTADYHIFKDGVDTQTTRLENGIDIKAGSNRKGKLRVHNNRIWGFRRRPTSGSRGEGINIHRLARNIEISNNIIGDCPIGMKDDNWPTTGNLGPKTITFPPMDDVVTPTMDVVTPTEEHRFLTGQGLMELTTTGTLPAGLSADIGYYIIVVNPTTFQLAKTYKDATAKTPKPVTFSDNGTGTHRIRIKAGQSRNITVTGNQFHDIRNYAKSDAPAVWMPITDIKYTNNYIARSKYLCAEEQTKYYGPEFTNNILEEVDNIPQPPQSSELNYHEDENPRDTHTGPYDTYERKRWTGIEVVNGAIRLDPV